MDYLYLRLFLTRRETPPLLARMAVSSVLPSRRQYLRQQFALNWKFAYRTRPIVYHHFTTIDEVMVGVIGRQRRELVSGPPERDFAPEEIKMWYTANCFIDTAQDEDGQKLAVQQHPHIGAPLPIVDALAHQINQSDPDSPYQISVNAISEEQSFWEFISKNRDITEIKFKFVAPNILGGGDKTREESRNLRDDVNMQELDVSVINKDGKLNTDSKQVRESVDYLSEGGGSLEAKKGKKIVYRSESNVRKTRLEEDVKVPEEQDEGILRRAIRNLFGR